MIDAIYKILIISLVIILTIILLKYFLYNDKFNKSKTTLDDFMIFVIHCDIHKDRENLWKDKKWAKFFPCVSRAQLTVPVLKELIKRNMLSTQNDLSVTEIAISLSHISTCFEFLKSDKKYLLIFEDDFIPTDNIFGEILQVIDKLEPFDVFHLLETNYSGCKNKISIINGVNHNKSSYCHGAAAYILTKQGARELAKNAFPIVNAIDNQKIPTHYDKRKHLSGQSTSINTPEFSGIHNRFGKLNWKNPTTQEKNKKLSMDVIREFDEKNK